MRYLAFDECITGLIIGLASRSSEVATHKLLCDTEAIERIVNHAERAPGKPTEKDGFIPKKKWDGKKVPHPDSGQYGYPDNTGAVWVPTGEKAHRGPHWDVIDKDGNHANVLPKK